MAVVNEIIRLRLFYSAANMSQAQTVFTFRVSTDAIADADIATILGTWVETDWHGDWSDIASNEVTLDGWEAEVVNTDGTIARNIGADSGLALAGDVISDNDSAAVSGYMQAYTSDPKARGAKYVPGVADARIENGVLNATTLAQLAVLALTWITDIPDPGGSGFLNPGVLSIGELAFKGFLDSIYVTDVPAYQRRRKPNVGS